MFGATIPDRAAPHGRILQRKSVDFEDLPLIESAFAGLSP